MSAAGPTLQVLCGGGPGGQGGIISCLAVCPALPVWAAGSFDRTVGVYSEEGERLCVLRGQQVRLARTRL